MRNLALTVVLILVALLPIVAWGYAAYGFALSYLAEAGSRRTWASAMLLLLLTWLTPAFVGGILMVVGAVLLGRKPLAGRIAASIGIALIVGAVVVIPILEGELPDYIVFIAAAVYVLLHCALMAWLWRSRRAAAL